MQNEKPNNVQIPVMPWERKQADTGVTDDSAEAELKSSLFDALGSDPLYAEDEEPQGDDKPAGGKRKTRTPEPEEDDTDEDDEDVDDEVDEEDVEDEGESDSEEESQQDDSEDVDEEADSDDEDTQVVEINGREYTLAQLAELDARGMRQADYTRKTQALAKERDALAAQKAEVGALRDNLAAQLEQVETFLQSLMPEEPDWEKLYAESPEKFAAEYAAHEMRKKQLNAVAERRKQLLAEQQEEFKQQLRDRVDSEAKKLIEAVPEWKDAKVAAREKAQLVEYLKSDGYTYKDLEVVVDHRPMLYALKAMRYDAMRQRKDKLRAKVKTKPVLKPGARVTVRDGAKLSKRKKVATKAAKLARSGRVEDFADLLVEELGDALL